MNGLAFIALLAPLTAFLLHLLVTHTFFRLRPPASRQKAAAWVSVGNVLLWTAGAFLMFGARPEMFFFCLTSASFSLTYFLVWNCTVTARRVRVLVGLYTGQTGNKVETYGPALMIEQRLQRLEGMGAIRREGQRLFAVPGILLSAGLLFRGWRRFFHCDELERFHDQRQKG